MTGRTVPSTAETNRIVARNRDLLEAPAPMADGASPAAVTAEYADSHEQAPTSTETQSSAYSADSAAAPEPPAWEEPTPLGATDAPPRFPVKALPGWLAEWVAAEATATQTPPDLPGLMSLAALSATAAGRVEVEARDGWREPVNLFVAVALPPGTRKSQVFRDATRPLAEWERDAAEQARPAIVEATTQKEVAERAAAAATAKAGKITDPNERENLLAEAISATDSAESTVVPAVPRLLVDDATPEALAGLLAEHGRIALLSPEGDVFNAMAGRYQSNGGPNLDVYLKGHAGDPLRVDRRARSPEYVERPALTVGLAVQPEVLRPLGDRSEFRGKGLLARFLYSVPVSTVGRRQVGAPPVPQAIGDQYRAKLKALLERLNGGGKRDDAPRVLVLSPDANEVLLEFERELEPKLAADGGDLGHIADWGSKLAGATVRIAGLLHLAEEADSNDAAGIVSPESLVRAIGLAHYLTGQALLAFDLIGADPRVADARYVLGWVQRTGKRSFTRRDLLSGVPRSRFPKTSALDPALDLLEEHGYLRLEAPAERSGRGRKPSPVYQVNPAVFETRAGRDDQAPRHNRQGAR